MAQDCNTDAHACSHPAPALHFATGEVISERAAADRRERAVMSDDAPVLPTLGSLAEHDLPHLVQGLYRQSWTGNVSLSRGEARILVAVRNGQLVFAASSNPDHRLGPLLLQRGTVTLREITEAGKAVAPGRRLGKILVEGGMLSPKELVRAVVDQTQEIVYHAFQWAEGQFELQPGRESTEAITLNISTPNIILEGISRITSWSRIVRGVGGLDTKYVRTPEGQATAHEMFLSSEQRSLLEDAAIQCDVETLCGRSTLSDFEVCRSLWAFAVIGVVRRIAPQAPLPDDHEGLAYIASGG